MKKALILIASSIIAAGMLASCKPEEKGGEDAAKVEITSDAKINVPVDGNTYKVAFNATVAWKATLSEGADAFAALTPSSGDAGDAEITLQVRANRGGEERAFTLTITAGTASGVVEFTQEAAATANVKVEALTAVAEGETLELPVESNVRCAIEADVEWIKISAPKAVTEVKYVVDVLPNPTLEQRTGNITVSPEGLEDIIVPVTQAALVPHLAIGSADIVPQAGGTVELEVDANIEFVPEFSGIDDIETTVDGNKITIVFPANEALAPRSLYIKITAQDFDEESVPAVGVYVTQLGHATIDWSVQITTAEPIIESNTTLPIALSKDNVLMSDGFDVFVFKASDGSFVKKVTPSLEGYYPKSLANDDAGHIIMADTYASGTEGAKVWWADDIDSTPAELFSFTQDVYNNMGNFRVHGDVTGSAVVSADVSASQYWAAFQITGGSLDGSMVRAEHPAEQTTVWNPFYGVCEPYGDKISDGFFYGTYPARPNLWFCTDPANNTWSAVISSGVDWDTCLNSMDVVTIGSKKYLLYLATGFFTYSNVHFRIYDVTDPAAAKQIGSFGSPFYSGADATSAYGGGGIVGKVTSDGKTLEIYVCDGSRDTLAKISVPVDKL